MYHRLIQSQIDYENERHEDKIRALQAAQDLIDRYGIGAVLEYTLSLTVFEDFFYGGSDSIRY